MLEKSFLFSRDELAMLLSKSGINYFYGFDLSSLNESPRKYIIFMNNLIKAGFLNVGEESIKFSTELSEIFRCIAESSYVTVFYPSMVCDSVKCFYVSGNKAVLLQVYNHADEKIKLTQIYTDEIYDHISCETTMGYSAENKEDEPELDSETKSIIDFAVSGFPNQDASELKSFDYIEWVADVVPKSSENIVQRCFTINGEECSYIVKIEKNSVDIDVFTDSRAKQYLTGLYG